jgi:hypothetical protein
MVVPTTLLLRRFSVLVFVLACAGCSQPGGANLISPTEPGTVSGGSSPSARSGALAAQNVAPTPAYSVNGTVWFVGVKDRPDGDESWVTVTSQDSAGNITFLDEDNHVVTLTRVSGSGPVAIFDARFAVPGDTGECDALLTGKARLFAKTPGSMVITISLAGVLNDCKHHTVSVTLEQAS